MSATLELRLAKDLRGAETEQGAIANVLGLDSAGQRLADRDRRNVVIPAGYFATPLPVNVEPGAYLVEATLPSGDVASQQVTVAEGEVTLIDLQAEHSPHEWLSWQQYLGNVPARPEVTVRRRAPRRAQPRAAAGPAHPSIDRMDRLRDSYRVALRAGGDVRALGLSAPGRGGGLRLTADLVGVGGALGWAGDFAPAGHETEKPKGARPTRPRRPPQPKVSYIGDPADELAGRGADAGDPWALVVADATLKAPEKALSRTRPGPIAPTLRDPERSLVLLGSDGGLGPVDEDPGYRGYVPRRYVLARSRDFTELGCLPVPWESLPGRRVPIEILVRRSPLPGEAALAMSPRDPNVGPALGYMAAGSLVNAQLIFERAHEMLYEKGLNALAAAAGGYVLLALEQGATAQPWHWWINNLADWFDWLPDGMIQRGRLLLRHRQGKDDVAAARAALFAAYDRGLPFYSLGLQWLVDGLSQFPADDKEARTRLARVQEVAWRANLQQPFTTIRLAPR